MLGKFGADLERRESTRAAFRMELALRPLGSGLIRSVMFHCSSFRSLSFLSVVLGASSCVSQARYDDAMHQLDVEARARVAAEDRGRRLDVQLEELEAQVKKLSEDSASVDRALEEERERSAELRFESDVVVREREEARLMSEQLRAELSRVAEHLRAYADDKELLTEEREQLASELSSARQRLDALAADEHAAMQRFQAARELTLALAEPLRDERIRLLLVDGQIAVRFSNGALFEPDGAELIAEGGSLVDAVARVLSGVPATVSVHAGASEHAERRVGEVTSRLTRLGVDVPEAQAVSRADEDVAGGAEEAAVAERPRPSEAAAANPTTAGEAEVRLAEADADAELRLHLSEAAT